MAVAREPQKPKNPNELKSIPQDVEISFRMVDLCRMTERYLSDKDVKKVYNAFMIAADAHDGVMRQSGEPYITHPVEVAGILADLHLDADSICAALLHDVIEDTDFTYDDIVALFSEKIAELVEGVTKLSSSKFESKQDAGIASFHKMMQAMVKDYRVVLIKLADRLHNVKTLGAMRPDKQRRIAKETLEIHAPLARRMGMNSLRHKLQAYAFQSLYPMRSLILENWWESCLKQNEHIYNAIQNKIQAALDEDELVKYSSVFPWEKNLYRLYDAERRRPPPFRFNRSDTSYDLRILTQNALECYRALGIVHQLYRPKMGAIKDFISVPKVYGFQALQTTVITNNQELIRIQIQSKEMYQVAQYGVAAQWRFPYLSQQNKVDMSQRRLASWLEQVKEIQDASGTPLDFLEDMKADFFLKEVSVMTPKGDPKILRSDATPVDFAYAIHTDVGHQCIAAFIDGKKSPLNTQLHDGATVKIITSKNATPRPSWLNFVVTGKARSAIRHWNNAREKEDFIVLGKKLLETTVSRFDTTLDQISANDKKQLLSTLEVMDENTLYSEIAKGNQCPKIVARRLLGNIDLQTTPSETPFYIKGAKGLAVHLTDCCHPIPSDNIVAHIAPNSGLMIHRSDCVELKHVSANNKMTSSWELDDDSLFLVPIQIQVRNNVGVLFSITDVIQKANVDIEDMNITGDKEKKELRILIQVHDKKQLQQLMTTLQKEPAVTSVSRLFKLSSGIKT